MDKTENRENPEAKNRVGVYICYCGGNISDHVDVEKVRERVENLPGVAVARTNMFMCSDPGQQLIMDDLKNGTVDRIVVASCAPSLHETTFRSAVSRAGANPYIYEHANIREQVSWVHHGDPATEKAEKLISMAAAKAGKLVPLEPIRVNARKHATVIGGGIAGLRVAKDLADCGIEVALIEKTPFLGGNLASLDRIAPTGESAKDLLCGLAREVLQHPAITVHTCAGVESFSGYVGSFTLGIKKQSSESVHPEAGKHRTGDFVPFAGVFGGDCPNSFVIETGVVVLATGFKSCTPGAGEYGFGTYREVITLPELIKHMASGRNLGNFLEVNGKKIRSMAIIHCVGSRQIPGIHPENESGHLNEYCSRVCCTAALNTANMIRQTYSGTRIYDFYRDIRTYGRDQETLYEQTARNQVVFFRFEPDEAPQVSANSSVSEESFPLCVKVKDVLTFGEEIEAPVDLVVLATGIEPNNVSDLVEKMKLPVGTDRFLLEVHPKLRPVELPVSGIFLAGTCQAPMDTGESCNAAGAAAAKAAALLDRGYVELDPFVAEVNPEKCIGTGDCVSACIREGALRLAEVEKDGQIVKQAQVSPALCLGCGACVAVCSQNAIDIAGWTLSQYEAMVDRIVAEEIPA
ncbi:MAG: CoB--CoM heterodisulfide reductase iron-sulfur subunit A family protein [Desulfococcaceae bacterium]